MANILELKSKFESVGCLAESSWSEFIEKLQLAINEQYDLCQPLALSPQLYAEYLARFSFVSELEEALSHIKQSHDISSSSFPYSIK